MYLPAEPGALLQFQLPVHEKTREYRRKSDKKMSYTNVKQSSISFFCYSAHNEIRIDRVDIKKGSSITSSFSRCGCEGNRRFYNDVSLL
jgi:hypothetical protein